MLEVKFSHTWNLTVNQAKSLQEDFSALVETIDRLSSVIIHVAGVDIAYETGGERLFASAVVQDVQTLQILHKLV